MSAAQDAESVAKDKGVPCPATQDGDHALRYAEGDWYCPHCYASLRLGVWYPAHLNGDVSLRSNHDANGDGEM